MDSFKEKLVSMLFETKALRVSPENKPFWYTSGTIGPYYINTHFLYGSEEKAVELLDIIDKVKHNKTSCPDIILEKTLENYYSDPIYKELIDAMGFHIKEKVDTDAIDYISGGERRDWFFSLIIAHFLKKPHITIYKDMETVLTDSARTRPINTLNGGNVLHIADLITEASSYIRTWIPSINNINGKIRWSLVVVDRKQGGHKLLESKEISSMSMIEINSSLFSKSLALGLITGKQFKLLSEYIEDPFMSMKKFLSEHPEFLQDSLDSDENTRERAMLCIEKKYYE